MSKTGLNRRQFLDTAGRILTGSVLALSAAGLGAGGAVAIEITALTPHTAKTLLAITRRLFPHPALSDSVYGVVVTGLDGQAAAAPQTRALLEDGVAALDRAGGGAWIDRKADLQVADLGKIEATPFFQTVRRATVRGLYRHREMWKLGGYEGSSVEYGGYVDRGFDDIDWLPED